MGQKIDLTGIRFGLLVVIKEVEAKGSQSRWLCICDCGNESIKQLGNLRGGHTKSCGHLRSEVTTREKTTHAMYGTPEHKSWQSMLTRCFSKNNFKYPDYGGRGITVCEQWKTFTNFFNDMGERPNGTTLGRINNDGNYEQSNCRWETNTQQARNKRNTTRYLFDGLNATLAEHCENLSLKISTVKTRIFSYKWDIEKALTTPVCTKYQPKSTTKE